MTLKKVFLTIVSTLVMVIPVKVIHMLLDVSYTSRIVDIVVMLGCGGLIKTISETITNGIKKAYNYNPIAFSIFDLLASFQ